MTTAALGLVLLSAALHAFWNFTARRVAGNLAVIWLGTIAAALAFCVPAAGRLSGQAPALPFVLLTGAISTLYFLTVAKAYEHGEMSFVYPIARGVGIVAATLGARLILGERPSASAQLGLLVVCGGVVGLSYGRAQAHGLRHAVLMGLLIASSAVLDKAAMSRADPFVYMCGMMSLPALSLSPYMLSRHREKCADAFRLHKREALVIGLGASASYSLVLWAFKTADVSRVIPFRELSVVFGAALGVALLGERLTARKAACVAAICAGLFLVRL